MIHSLNITKVQCKCQPGYNGNGIGPEGCSKDNISCDKQCKNGYCVVQNGAAVCLCFQGFSGDLCDKAADPCLERPCLNGGSCSSNGESFSCSCTPEWSGSVCDVPLGECGGNLAGDSGSLAYPGGGNMYPANAKCDWFIVVGAGKTVVPKFTKFDLEAATGNRCHDSVTLLTSGDQGGQPHGGPYCGTSIPTPAATLHSDLQVSFISDSRNQATGFTMEWSSGESECGGRLTSSVGTVQSPGFPTGYSNSVSFCNWIIDVQTQKIIEITFESFEVGKVSLDTCLVYTV